MSSKHIGIYHLIRPQNEQLPAIESFLATHAESSMFIRSNFKSAGLAFEGRDFQGEYLVTLDGSGQVNGVFVHYWNGTLMMQAPDLELLGALIERFKEQVTRPVSAIIGPAAQVSHTIEALSLNGKGYSTNAIEGLYALKLSALSKERLANNYQVVPAHAADRELLTRWLKSYEIEALGRTDSPELDVHVEDRVSRMIENSSAWVMLAAGIPVSLSGFNARLPEMVQVGPVWTPPEQRGQGHARHLVSETLRMAAAEGVKKSILFTDNPAAIRAYQAIGFTRIGEYQLAMLREAVEITS